MLKSKSNGLKPLVSLALLTVITFAQSCKKSDLPKQETVSAEEVQQLKTFVSSSTGLPLGSVEFNSAKNIFVAGKDIVISLANARQRLKNTDISSPTTERESQRVYTYTVTPTNVANIAIYADNTVPTDWLAALDQAIANWNGTNSHVYMKRVTATTVTTTSGRGKKQTTSTSTVIPPYNIIVKTLYDNTTSMVAQAYMPYSDGTVGNEVDINTYYSTLGSSYKTFAITHELGHTIGFTHTDGTYGNLIPGTPTTDPNSVMNSVVLPWNGYTQYDIVAVTTIYPK
ncbi:MAG: M57 family metalloprotease [Flavisolibacter sp.]